MNRLPWIVIVPSDSAVKTGSKLFCTWNSELCVLQAGSCLASVHRRSQKALCETLPAILFVHRRLLCFTDPNLFMYKRRIGSD